MCDKIIVRYRSVDGYRKVGRFKTLTGARCFAQNWVGKTPDIGIGYAVSSDGIGIVRCEGCRLEDLFGEHPESLNKRANQIGGEVADWLNQPDQYDPDRNVDSCHDY